VASAGAVEKLTGWLKRKGLTPWRAALGVGTWTGVKPASRLKPAIGPAPPGLGCLGCLGCLGRLGRLGREGRHGLAGEQRGVDLRWRPELNQDPHGVPSPRGCAAQRPSPGSPPEVALVNAMAGIRLSQ
jgi:hypothetical protein